MKTQELEKYEKLQDVFQTRCEKICSILRPLDDEFDYVYNFEIHGDNICGWGYEEREEYGIYEQHYAEFPKEYIHMKDSAIRKIVNAEIKKISEEEAQKIANYKKLIAEKEKNEYERLKKIYG